MLLLKNILFAIVLFSILLIHHKAICQPGANDPTFNPADVGFGFGDGFNNSINAIAIQGDGKINCGRGVYFLQWNRKTVYCPFK